MVLKVYHNDNTIFAKLSKLWLHQELFVTCFMLLRHREVMLLQAVLERYGEQLPGVTPESMIKEFLGPAPAGTGDKIKGGEGSFSNRGALDIDTRMADGAGVESMDLGETASR